MGALPAGLLETIPAEYRHYVTWCVDEYDPVNPYHDAWSPDGHDPYETEILRRTAAIHSALTTVAVMCDATYGFVKRMD